MPFVAQIETHKCSHNRVARFDNCIDGTCDGTLTIFHFDKKGNKDTYQVTEFDHDFDGRAFRLSKVGQGEGYDVLLATAGPRSEDICDCHGFTRFGHCKHIGSLKAVIDQGALYLEADLVNPDSDVSNTDREYYMPPDQDIF